MPDRSQNTEQPTPRRLQQARGEGQIPFSRDLTQAAEFTLAVAALGWAAGPLMHGLEQSARGLFSEAFEARPMDPGRLNFITRELLRGPLSSLWILGAVLVAAGLIGHFLQTGFAITPKRLALDFSRLSPAGRLSMLPEQNLRETVKALWLFPLFGWACWAVIRQNLGAFLELPRTAPVAAAALVAQSISSLLAKAAVALLALGAWDYIRERRKLYATLRMTKQEIRQEQKELEGNPLIKARFRRLQREMIRKRMMSRVPKASVVITNPTHYAVALEYRLEAMRAPVIVAKGQNYMASPLWRTRRSHRRYTRAAT